MSDATLPQPRSSSEAPEAPGTEGITRLDSSSEEAETSLPMGQSSGDSGKEDVATDSNPRDSKQKRKRTSPKDQAILEAEYKQNPKPNKAARAEIVEKVSLNEKEVQIWFQNRRQINRRKSRPLLPHEIAAFGLGGMAALSSDPASMLSYGSSQEDRGSSLQPERASSEEGPRHSQNLVDTPAPDVPTELEEVTRPATDAVSENTPLPTLKQDLSSEKLLPGNSSFSITDSVIKSFSSTPGYLSNRWNAASSSFSTPPTSSQAFSFTTPPLATKPQPNSCPERIDTSFSIPASRMRLSLSLDGKAELVSADPSPPRQRAPRPTSSSGLIPQERRRGLQRSFSAMPFSSRSPINQTNPPFVPRLPTGRSRDARTWEFCADGEARDELTLQAENESHGSAIAAISLLRSSSNTALKSNSNKRNAQPHKQEPSKQAKRPKLGRATSSLARLQNPSDISAKSHKQPTDYSKDGLMRSPSGDSDKENWLPKEGGGNPRRRPLPSSRSESSKPILGDNRHIPTHAVDFPGAKNRKRKNANVAPEIFEDQEIAPAGNDVEKFMRGEVSPSKKGDLDCIQGLLSLSQGNWR